MKPNKKTAKIEKRLKKEWSSMLFNGLFALLTVTLAIIFYKNIILTTALIAIVSIVGLIKWKSKITLIIFIFSAFFGALSEMFAINFGVWQYSIINFYNIPFWLFLVWGNAGAFLYQTGIELHKLGVAK